MEKRQQDDIAFMEKVRQDRDGNTEDAAYMAAEAAYWGECWDDLSRRAAKATEDAGIPAIDPIKLAMLEMIGDHVLKVQEQLELMGFPKSPHGIMYARREDGGVDIVNLPLALQATMLDRI